MGQMHTTNTPPACRMSLSHKAERPLKPQKSCTENREQIQNFWKTEIYIQGKNIHKEQPDVNKE